MEVNIPLPWMLWVLMYGHKSFLHKANFITTKPPAEATLKLWWFSKGPIHPKSPENSGLGIILILCCLKRYLDPNFCVTKCWFMRPWLFRPFTFCIVTASRDLDRKKNVGRLKFHVLCIDIDSTKPNGLKKTYPPQIHKGLIEGLIEGKPMVNKPLTSIRPAISRGGTLGGVGWLAMIKSR